MSEVSLNKEWMIIFNTFCFDKKLNEYLNNIPHATCVAKSLLFKVTNFNSRLIQY